MKRSASKNPTKSCSEDVVIGARVFEAITAVEGLTLSKESRQQLKALQSNRALSPDQRREAVMRAYATMSTKR